MANKHYVKVHDFEKRKAITAIDWFDKKREYKNYSKLKDSGKRKKKESDEMSMYKSNYSGNWRSLNYLPWLTFLKIINVDILIGVNSNI